MKTIDSYLTEKLHISKNIKLTHEYCPEDKFELIDIIVERIQQNGIRKQFDGDLNDIDVSRISDMMGFASLLNNRLWLSVEKQIGNIDISEWDVSNLTNAQSMFFGLKNFNCDLSKWNVENLENANAMFAGCSNLNFDISKWNPKKLDKSKTFKMIANTKLEKQDWMR